jgi:hypothetical protein
MGISVQNCRHRVVSERTPIHDDIPGHVRAHWETRNICDQPSWPIFQRVLPSFEPTFQTRWETLSPVHLRFSEVPMNIPSVDKGEIQEIVF